MVDENRFDDIEIAALLRPQLLAVRYGIRRDRSTDLFRRSGWWSDDATPPSEIRLKFRPEGEGVPPLRGMWVGASETEFVIRDKRGRAWALSRSLWSIDQAGKLRP